MEHHIQTLDDMTNLEKDLYEDMRHLEFVSPGVVKYSTYDSKSEEFKAYNAYFTSQASHHWSKIQEYKKYLNDVNSTCFKNPLIFVLDPEIPLGIQQSLADGM